MTDPIQQKQWWAPVWKGLVMDLDAKHYRQMKNAVWLYLYLLVNANRVTGLLMRKIRTISKDMGIPRDTAVRWLNVLRKHGYIATLNTGRSLTIQVKNFKSLARYGKTRPQTTGTAHISSGKYPIPLRPATTSIPLHFAENTGPPAPPNNTKINRLLNNETHSMQHAIANGPNDGAFKSIGFYAHRELLAWELAKALDDPAGINLYRSYCHRYPEELVRRALNEAGQVPAIKLKKGRIALFCYLLQHHAQGTTKNPGR
jgi:hypothetical protein